MKTSYWTVLGLSLLLAHPLAAQTPATQPATQSAPATQLAGKAEMRVDPAITQSEFIFLTAPFRSCHASAIVQTPTGLVAAWFGGTAEGRPDVGVWLARREKAGWTAPVEVANGIEPDGRRFPAQNPVFFQVAKGPLLMWYKVGPAPHSWWAYQMTSADGGKTWSKAHKLPEGFLGPIKNKPYMLPDGTLLCGSSREETDGGAGWRVFMERTKDLGATWEKVGPLNDGQKVRAIQPTIFAHGGDKIQIICRGKGSFLWESWSKDGGRTWSDMTANSLPSTNSGIDGLVLKDGRALLVYNHTSGRHARTPLNVAVSADGRKWQAALVLEDQPGEYSYPAVIQASDGLVHVTYTWKRERIKHVVLDPAKLVLRNGRWPAIPQPATAPAAAKDGNK